MKFPHECPYCGMMVQRQAHGPNPRDPRDHYDVCHPGKEKPE